MEIMSRHKIGIAIIAAVRIVEISCEMPIPDTNNMRAERKPVKASRMISAAEAVTITLAGMPSSL